MKTLEIGAGFRPLTGIKVSEHKRTSVKRLKARFPSPHGD